MRHSTNVQSVRVLLKHNKQTVIIRAEIRALLCLSVLFNIFDHVIFPSRELTERLGIDDITFV